MVFFLYEFYNELEVLFELNIFYHILEMDIQMVLYFDALSLCDF